MRLIDKEVIAFDGEGIDNEGKQLYAMLVASNGNYIIDINGLSSIDCLYFLWNNAQNRLAVGYGFNYDVNMILRDLAPSDLYIIYRNGEVFYKGFYIRYEHNKTLKIRLEGYEQYITIWDTLPFFQITFIKALDSFGIEYDRELVESGKKGRGVFCSSDIKDFVFPYCLEECKALKRLIGLLCRYLDIAKLPINRFDGAGAIGAKLLEVNGVKKHITETPPEVREAAVYAYSGGRMECFQYGHTEQPVYHYDINSAYPNAARCLPSLVGGNWVKNTCFPEKPETMALYLVEWDLPEQPIYPFSYRCPDMSIIYPQQGKNWVYASELWAYSIYHSMNDIKVLDGYLYIPGNTNMPFSFLEDVYNTRQKWKFEGIGAEKVLKLGINSVYGKLAQQAGYNWQTGKRPPFHQLEYAGYITAFTRSMLYHAMMQKPEAIIACATDGIYSLKPLFMNVGTGLGQWEGKIHNSMTIVQSGVYWLDSGEKETSYYRGFNPGTIERLSILSAWDKGDNEYLASTTRFRSMGCSLRKKGDGIERHCEWETVDRALCLTMRNFDTKRIDLSNENPSKGLIKTTAAFNVCFPDISTPYPLQWIEHSSPEEVALAFDLAGAV